MTTTTPRWRVVRKHSFTWYQGYCWAAIYGTDPEDWQRYEEFATWAEAYDWAREQAAPPRSAQEPEKAPELHPCDSEPRDDAFYRRLWLAAQRRCATSDLGPMPTPEARPVNEVGWR